jgi:hypothetical protein
MDGAKAFNLSPYVLNLPPVKDYYAARQKILLGQLKEPPAVWIGGEQVSLYMEDFFEERPVLQEGEVRANTSGTVSAYGLSEYVLREDNTVTLFGLQIFHPSYVLYVHTEEAWKQHASTRSSPLGSISSPLTLHIKRTRQQIKV